MRKPKVHNGKQRGGQKNGTGSTASIDDAQQGSQFDVTASNAAACPKGNKKKQHAAGKKTKYMVKKQQEYRQPRSGLMMQKDGKQTPWKKRKQGSIANLSVLYIIPGERKQKEQGN